MSYQTFTLYLSRGGEYFENPMIITNPVYREIIFETDNVHPKLRETQDCKTYQTVLAFLKSVESDQAFLNHVSLYHIHNPKYPGHGLYKGAAHKDTIEQMISFVEKRIQEKSSPHAVFDKIGKGLGRTIYFLSSASTIPIIGTIPAAIKILIGVIQIIGGVALSILSAIPAISSENARIIFQRSAKHIRYGVCNIVVGAIEGVPLVATWMYYSPNRRLFFPDFTYERKRT